MSYAGGELSTPYYSIVTKYATYNSGPTGAWSDTPPTTPGQYCVQVEVRHGDEEVLAVIQPYNLTHNPDLFTIEIDHKDSVGTRNTSGSHTYHVYYAGMGEYPIVKAGYDGGKLPAGYSIKYSYASYEGLGADLGYDDLYHRKYHFCCGSSNDTY